ncbi:hypothetical protein N7517_006515 [Penicillium concentricum]|uniref:Uncharacterized protein n=1 Tax=Penicillium concentricum TaxID=293559 RepID=A0A9W9SC90_9EURO|nr:uncharacterized protein N7517_006515 [Penicillium concentricum]KAJ5374509.1 hypothetical protein N7517_006515 [Penicillium concentricum]
MTSFKEKAHELLASIPTGPCEWPKVVVCDSIVSSKLGMQANPIGFGDDLALLSSASNPTVIHVDEGWCRDETNQLSSDADTEIMAIPEFWALTGGNFTVPVYKGEAVPTRSPVCEDREDLRSFEQSTPNCFHLDGKAPKVTVFGRVSNSRGDCISS